MLSGSGKLERQDFQLLFFFLPFLFPPKCVLLTCDKTKLHVKRMEGTNLRASSELSRLLIDYGF